MSIALLAISDGRYGYHARSLVSALEQLPKFDQYVFVDDPGHDLGFAGAIQTGWEQIRADWVFHLELDFTFHSPVPVERMRSLLGRHPYLAQVALKRQAVNEEERAAGGIVECNPAAFEERADAQAVWTVNRRCFTTNPSVYSSALCRRGWPQERHSEGVFTHQMIQDPVTCFAFWGAKYDPPLCEHIGDARVGKGY